MATAHLIPFRATTVRSCAAFRNHESSQTQKTSNSKWWAPLFSWSSEPDYFDSSHLRAKAGAKSDTEPIKSRIAAGSFTEEKARKLRMMTKDTAFHDAMYHSAIASRLAFDSNDRSDL